MERSKDKNGIRLLMRHNASHRQVGGGLVKLEMGIKEYTYHDEKLK